MTSILPLVSGILLLSAAPLLAADPPSTAIPADAEKAAQALAASPRHGEWVDIALPHHGPTDQTPAKIHTWVVYPERKDKAPVVIVIHEIFGLTDWVRAVADQLAAEGFIAVAPDLLSGMGPNGGGTESLGDKVRDTIRTLTPEQTAVRLNAVRAHALALPAAAPRSASIGFCWGGSASFAYATQQAKLDAAVVYYGTGPVKDGKPDSETLAKIGCPVLGLYGGDDARVTSTVDATSAAMAELEKSFTHHTFPGAGHGFLRQQSGREGANLRAAQEAWAKTVEFLRQNLR